MFVFELLHVFLHHTPVDALFHTPVMMEITQCLRLRSR